MQNAQNNTSNFTVENLVAKYRNHVSKHCPVSGYACEGNNGKMVEGYVPVSPDANADEQLLVTLYSSVTGCKADKDVLNVLSGYAEKYQKDALLEEEFAFLCNNFKEVVAYEFSHRAEWGWDNNCQSDKNREFLSHRNHHTHNTLTSQSFEIIKTQPKPEAGQTVFISDSGYCDVAMLFPGCTIKGYTAHEHFNDDNETWALGQIRLYAAGIKSEILPTQTGLTPEYLSDVDYAIWGMSRHLSKLFYEGAEMLCQHIHPNGRMFLLMNRDEAVGTCKTLPLRKRLVDDRLIDSILSFEEHDERLNISRKRILISASKSTHHTVRMQMIPGDKYEFPSDILDHEILWPSYYAAQKPESGIPLSSIVSFVDLDIEWEKEWDKEYFIQRNDGEYILSEKVKKMPVAVPADMAEEYKDANLCEANLKLAGDPIFKDWTGWIRRLDQPCVLLYGRGEKYVAGYVKDLFQDGMATLDTIACLVPKEGIDVRYVAALLLSPEVKEQITTICEGDVNVTTIPLIIDKVVVPNHTEKERWAFLSETNYKALVLSQREMRQVHEDYKRAVRMRKHSLTQSLTSIEAMFYALNAYRISKEGKISDDDIISRVKGNTVHEAFEFLSQSIEDMMPALEHIADVEYSFSKPEWIDPERFVEGYIKSNEKGWLNFKPILSWEEGHNQAVEDIKNPTSGEIIIHKGDAIEQFLFPKDALERVFKNIISNAQSHGFTDKSRKDYQLKFSWHMNGMALIIEIENNGTPIPNDRDTASLLEYGVSTALHHDGHNGIGCNEIDDIMQRYDGKVEIISSPENLFPVKYVLTFNRSNTVRSF